MNTKKKWIDKLYDYSIDHFVNWKKHLKEYLWAIAIVLMIRSTLITIYRIPTGSMIPTFKIGDILVANHFYYGLKIPFTYGLKNFRLKPIKKPDRGDIVIFRGPREEFFYIINLLVFNKEGKAFLNQLNHLSSFKRPISIQGTQTNYIFLPNPSLGKENTIITLHHSVYKKFLKGLKKPLKEPYLSLRIQILNKKGRKIIEQIQKNTTSEKNIFFYPLDKNASFITLNLPKSEYLDKKILLEQNEASLKVMSTKIEKKLFIIQGIEKQKKYITYHTNRYRGFVSSLINTPMAGLSIASTILINSPFFMIYKIIYNHFSNRFIFDFISFYPNKYIDTTKDYVKRVVAKEGDIVEIFDKKLFVNGKQYLSNLQNSHIDSTDNTFMLFEEKVSFDHTKNKIYPVRYNKFIDSKKPKVKFDASIWPLDPNNSWYFNGDSYRDHFGPIVVPLNHYFVLGDNRDESFDSRYWGFVPYYAIKGIPMVKLFPFNRFGMIK